MQQLQEAPIRVPSHYIVGNTTAGDFPLPNPVFTLGVSSFYQGLWSMLGIFCNLTPDESTVEATKAVKDAVEILTAWIPIGKAGAAKKTVDRIEGLLKALGSTSKEILKGEIFPEDPVPVGTPVLGFPRNDRLITVESQQGRLQITTGINEPRYASIFGIRKAMKKEIETLGLEDLGLAEKAVGEAGSKTSLVRLFIPEVTTQATILEGSPDEVSSELVTILKNEGVV
jgi:hypothetical protein